MLDEELRAELLKYMEVVPPVTDSTRKTLQIKLEKLRSHSPSMKGLETDDGTKEWAAQFQSAVVSVGSPLGIENEMPETGAEYAVVAASPPSKTVVRSPAKPTKVKRSPSPVSPQPTSPLLEYVASAPTYRRRSLHPGRPDLDNPYFDLDVSLEKNLYSPAFSRVHNSVPIRPNTAQSAKARLRPVLTLFSSIVFSLVALPIYLCSSIIGRLPSKILTSRRSLLFCLMVLITIGLVMLLFWDPFYHNPVADLRQFI